jgi:long-chain acyl-CoA synthetase
MEPPFGRAKWGTDVVVEDVLGWPCKVFTPRPTHLGQLLAEAGRHGDRAHLVAGDGRLGFDELTPAVQRLGARLAAEGLEPGDRLLLLGGNGIPWVLTFWAALCHGWILIPGNAWWSPEEVAHAVETVGARLAIADARRRGHVPRHLPTLDLETILDTGSLAEPKPPGGGGEDDPAVILFTSGTTSFPKGATLTHRGLLANLHNLLAIGRRMPGTEGEARPASVTLMTMPLFHIGGIQQLLTAVVGGATLVFLDGRFEPRRVAAMIGEEGITVWAAVPTMAARLLDVLEGDPDAYDVGSLKTLIMGGSPVSEVLRARADAAFPNVRRGLGISYGLTEVSGVVATAAGPVLAGRPGTVGRLLPTVEARIEDPDADGVGELLVRTPGVMRGYWGPDGSDGVLTPDRWLRTGDLARLDGGDLLSIVGRSKDVVIRGGENVAATRVEERLLEHPAVAEAMVVGLPHPDLGEEVSAAVVLHPGHEGDVDAGVLARFAAGTLAYFEVPTAWWFRGPLPVNASGKPLKRQVLEEWKNRYCPE